MLQNKLSITLCALLLVQAGMAQTMKLDAILDSIRVANPVVKMYDNEIRSMDEAAKGARSWMAPQVGAGQFMTPYNPALWKKEGDMPGMGNFMLSAEQMIPNRRKLDADEAYMNAMSAGEKQKKNATLNELLNDAKHFYYGWAILQKRKIVLLENERILEFMIKNAELRYRNGMDKMNAYYKAKAALGDLQNMQLMVESDIRESRIRLNALMNRNPMALFEIDTAFQWTDYADLVFDSTLFYASRSDLKAIDNDIKLAMLKQETERMSLKPQFGVRYDHMFGYGGQPMQYTLMGMVKLPILGWASRMNKANMESLKWKADALYSQKEMLVNEYSGMAYGMRNELELKKKQLQLYETSIIPALQKNYKTMQLGYEQNTEELFMLYDAWEALNMKQLQYYELMGQALQLQVAIERLIEKN
jgi:outer membrane protein TolC